MSANTVPFESRSASGSRFLRGAAVIALFSIIGFILGYFNVWLGISFLFIGLFVFTAVTLEQYQGRNLWLLLTVAVFAGFVMGAATLNFLVRYPGLLLPAGSGAELIIAAAGLVGLASAAVVILLFLIHVAIATTEVLKWYGPDSGLGFFAAYRHLLADFLGFLRVSVVIDDKEEIKGRERDVERLKHFGGPGQITIYPGFVVALHKRGRFTRAVGLGSTMLERGEQIRAIIPLGTQAGVNKIEQVLTADRVPLTFHVLHVVQMEPAEVTAAQPDAVTGNDHTIGDEYDKCYESVAKKVALKAPDGWKAMKGGIESNLKDVVMSCNFDDLFKIGESDELAVSINERKIAEIENIIKEKVEVTGPGKGLVLKAVDISQVDFPEEISDKINKQATALLDTKIELTKARSQGETAQHKASALKEKVRAQSFARVTEAESKDQAANFERTAKIKLAQAEVQAERLKAQAQAEQYREITRTLREEGIPAEAIAEILKNMAAANSLEKQMSHQLELMTHYIHGEHTGRSGQEDFK